MAYTCDPLGTGECEPVPPCNNTDPCYRRWCKDNCCMEEPVCVTNNPCLNVTCNMGNCLYTNLTGTPCNYGFGNCTNGICMVFPGYENAGPNGKEPSTSVTLILWLIFGIIFFLIFITVIAIMLYASRDRRPERTRVQSRIGKRV